MAVLYYFIVILILGYLILAFLYISTQLISSLAGVPFVRTPHHDVKHIFTIVKLTSRSHFIELGSGTANISLYIYSHYTQNVTAVELNPLLHAIAHLKKIWYRYSALTLILNNALHIDFKPATHIYLYMLPQFTTKIGSKILSECKRGTFIISYTFRIPELDSKLYRTLTKTKKPVYIYRI